MQDLTCCHCLQGLTVDKYGLAIAIEGKSLHRNFSADIRVWLLQPHPLTYNQSVKSFLWKMNNLFAPRSFCLC